MRARVDAAARTARSIVDATIALWREKALEEITLQEISDHAGVTVQTILRRFGSKEGVIEGCIEVHGPEIEAERDAVPVGDIDGAVRALLGHYERDGDAVLRTLAVEERLAAARKIVVAGRKAHREWCARVFAPYLPAPSSRHRRRRLDAFVAVTDVYLWRLLRRDLERSADQTRKVLSTLLESLVLNPNL